MFILEKNPLSAVSVGNPTGTESALQVTIGFIVAKSPTSAISVGSPLGKSPAFCIMAGCTTGKGLSSAMNVGSVLCKIVTWWNTKKFIAHPVCAMSAAESSPQITTSLGTREFILQESSMNARNVTKCIAIALASINIRRVTIDKHRWEHGCGKVLWSSDSKR